MTWYTVVCRRGGPLNRIVMEVEVEVVVLVVVGLWYRWWLVDIHIVASSSIYHDEVALYNDFINYREKERTLDDLSIAWYSDSDACIWYDA